MNSERRTRVITTFNLSEVIAALKLLHPHDLNVQVLPANGKGAAMETYAGGALRLTYDVETQI